MPYKNQQLKEAYKKRRKDTATPYMKEWREKNREYHREYMRKWAAKRRADAKKKKQDKERSVQSGSAQRFAQYNIERQRKWVDELSDVYIVGLLSRRGDLTRELAKQTPQIIELHRQILKTKRKLKEHDYNSNKLI